jgi:general secretion pathway protein L
MSGARFLLQFIGDDDAPAGWLRLVNGVAVARGTGAADIPLFADATESESVVLVVPGVDVILHWVDLPSLAPAQALAAARLLAADVSATPIDRLHVALGGASAGSMRCMAVADAEQVARWIAAGQALGLDPDHILPEPLLILPPDEGARCWEKGGLHLLRGDRLALAAEPALAALAVEGVTEATDLGDVELGLAAVMAALPVDLRQGSFAKRRRWRLDRARMRRLAMVAGGILLATLMVQGVLVLRYKLDADRLDRETEAIALRVLPRGDHLANPSAQLAGRLAELRGGGLGFSATAALFIGAVRDTPNIEVGSLIFDRTGTLRVTVLAPNAADLGALARRIEARRLVVESGEVRSGGGRQIMEMVVTP